MKKILVTAIGSVAAYSVIKELKKNGYCVVGCDINPAQWLANAGEVEDFFCAYLAKYDKEKYIAQMLEYSQANAVDMILPLTDDEVDVLCECIDDFASEGIIICTSPKEVTRVCRDKYILSTYIGSIEGMAGIPTKKIDEVDINDISFPCVIKPFNGRSSEGKMVARNIEDYEYIRSLRDDTIIQPFIQGDVYTVDIVRDVFGNVQALPRKECLRTKNGLGTAVEIQPDNSKLIEICKEIGKRAGFTGAVNAEFILHEGIYYFLEINPRFSGGVGFSLEAGFNVVMKHLDCFAGKELKEDHRILERSIFVHRYEIIKGMG